MVNKQASQHVHVAMKSTRTNYNIRGLTFNQINMDVYLVDTLYKI